MNMLESGQQLSSADIANIVGIACAYIAFHLAVGEAARYIAKETLGEEFDEESFEENNGGVEKAKRPRLFVDYPNHASLNFITFLNAGWS